MNTEDRPMTHDAALAVADGTGSCIFAATGGQCFNTAHFREMTFPERVQLDINNLRSGVISLRAIVLAPAAAVRIANLLDALLIDCTRQEQELNKLEAAVRELRNTQRAYMTARAERGGKDRAYDDTLNALGRAVSIAASNVDSVVEEINEARAV
jgi:hypothetical protein